jgi:pyrimidine operon attenuation protein/uracil phosphoribosyltransferase
MIDPSLPMDPSSRIPPVSAAPLLDAAALGRTLERIAREILERHPDPACLALIGIPSRGVELARRLGTLIAHATGVATFCGSVDISMHRDDIGARGSIPSVQASRLPAVLQEGTLLLVDDVLQSGRTCRAALDALASFGRPSRIEYAVLIDRGGRELPIAADYVGKSVEAAPGERVFVRLFPGDPVEGIWMERVDSTRRRAGRGD